MAGERGWWLLGGLLGGIALAPVACDPTPPDDEVPVVEAISALLADFGPEVVLPAVARFRVEVTALEAALEAGDLDAARAAWIASFAAWQQVELLQVGPAAPSLTAVGGADLRDSIYSWPTVNRCRVDQQTVAGGWDEADFFTTTLVNVHGLDALETLLFSPDGENACPSQVDINASGSWDALGSEGVQARRLEYARALAAKIGVDADTLADAWSPEGGDFSGALAEAREPWTSQHEALTAIFHAAFYLEVRTKDHKLAPPLGLGTCTTGACLEEVEATLAGQSTAAIVANLDGFRAAFTGGEGDGFDDLLVSLGYEQLATDVLARTEAARAAALALPVPVDAAAQGEHREALLAAHDAVKAVTDLLKTDVATVLALQLPVEAAGDND